MWSTSKPGEHERRRGRRAPTPRRVDEARLPLDGPSAMGVCAHHQRPFVVIQSGCIHPVVLRALQTFVCRRTSVAGCPRLRAWT